MNRTIHGKSTGAQQGGAGNHRGRVSRLFSTWPFLRPRGCPASGVSRKNMIDIYIFSSKNITNIWAGYGARAWAVSQVGKKEMETRMTKSMSMQPGALGLIYCSAEPKFFTMPFKVAGEVEW